MRQQLPPNIEQINDRQLLAIQRTTRQVAQAVNAFGPPPRTVGPFTFATPGQIIVIEHGLARQPISCVCIDSVGGYGSFQRTAWDDKTISIQSENSCVASFRIQ
jgi:hypothetical protein